MERMMMMMIKMILATITRNHITIMISNNQRNHPPTRMIVVMKRTRMMSTKMTSTTTTTMTRTILERRKRKVSNPRTQMINKPRKDVNIGHLVTRATNAHITIQPYPVGLFQIADLAANVCTFILLANLTRIAPGPAAPLPIRSAVVRLQVVGWDRRRRPRGPEHPVISELYSSH